MKLNPKHYLDILHLVQLGVSVTNIAKKYHVSAGQIYGILKRGIVTTDVYVVLKRNGQYLGKASAMSRAEYEGLKKDMSIAMPDIEVCLIDYTELKAINSRIRRCRGETVMEGFENIKHVFL